MYLVSCYNINNSSCDSFRNDTCPTVIYYKCETILLPTYYVIFNSFKGLYSQLIMSFLILLKLDGQSLTTLSYK